MASRFVSTDIPFIYGMQTKQLCELVKEGVSLTFKKIADSPVYINLNDFLIGCTYTNIYYCCLPEYTALTFRNAKYFIDNLQISDVFMQQYLADFKTALRLFGIDTAILNYWASFLYGKKVEVWPTIPKDLYTKLAGNPLLSFKVFDKQTPLPSEDEWLSVVGAIQREFKYTGEFSFGAMAALDSSSDTHSRYLFALMQSLLSPNYKEFLLYYTPKEDLNGENSGSI